jgi:excinuclease ABC subunit C
VGNGSFDRKFGAGLVRELPAEPAVYLFKDEDGTVLYAGKAKNVRRRMQGYRNAGRRKAQRKMLRLVRAASALEIRVQSSERDALLLENELIRTLRPRFNVDGAYSFLYPAIGTGADAHRALLCFTTRIDAFAPLGLRWHGCFRSRPRALEAFEDLVALLDFAGHREPVPRRADVVRPRGSRLAGYRRVDPLLPSLDAFLRGESPRLLAELATHLLEKPAARRAAAEVEERLRRLEAFFASDARKLREALQLAGRADAFVCQAERDALFIAHRSRGAE